MIAVDLAGGLGNLLFEYAFIYSAHRKLNARFFLVKKGTPILLYNYFNLKKNSFYYIDLLFFNHQGFKLFFSHYLKHIFTKWFITNRLTTTVTVDNWEKPAEALLKLKDNALYRGYFQSEVYFKPYRDELKAIFQVKRKYTDEFAQKFDWLKKEQKIVTIHVRRTDYQSAFTYLDLGSGDLSLPMTYYHQVIRQIHQPENFYVFISDDIAFVKKEFNYLEKKFFSEESEIIDFQLMQNADVCVLANSSFSWWSAYLNQKATTVYCPKYYLGFLKEIEYPTHIYPEHWIQIPVI